MTSSSLAPFPIGKATVPRAVHAPINGAYDSRIDGDPPFNKGSPLAGFAIPSANPPFLNVNLEKSMQGLSTSEDWPQRQKNMLRVLADLYTMTNPNYLMDNEDKEYLSVICEALQIWLDENDSLPPHTTE